MSTSPVLSIAQAISTLTALSCLSKSLSSPRGKRLKAFALHFDSQQLFYTQSENQIDLSTMINVPNGSPPYVNTSCCHQWQVKGLGQLRGIAFGQTNTGKTF